MENIIYIILLTFFPAVIIFTIIEKHRWNKKYIAQQGQVSVEELAKTTNVPLAFLQDLKNTQSVVTKHKQLEDNSVVEKVVLIDTEKSEVAVIQELAKKHDVKLYETSPESLATAFIATVIKDEFEIMKFMGIKQTEDYKKAHTNWTKDIKIELRGLDEDWIEINFSGEITQEKADKIATEIAELSPFALRINKQESKEKIAKKIMKGENVTLSWEE